MTGKTDFYVYAYLDPRRPGEFKFDEFKFGYEPFYIGKGINYRYKYHLWNNNRSNKFLKSKINKIRKEINIDPIIIKIAQNLSPAESLELEIRLIKLIGRIDNNTGLLCNFTDGGEGANNCLGRKWTEIQREKLMAIRKIKPPRLGMHNSKETKLKQSIAKKGKPLSQEHKKALSGRKFTLEHKQKLANKKNKKITAVKNDEILEFENAFKMADFFNISSYKAYRILRKNKIFNGYTFFR